MSFIIAYFTAPSRYVSVSNAQTVSLALVVLRTDCGCVSLERETCVKTLLEQNASVCTPTPVCVSPRTQFSKADMGVETIANYLSNIGCKCKDCNKEGGSDQDDEYLDSDTASGIDLKREPARRKLLGPTSSKLSHSSRLVQHPAQDCSAKLPISSHLSSIATKTYISENSGGHMHDGAERTCKAKSSGRTPK